MKPPFPIIFVWWQDAYVTTDEKPQLNGNNNLTISFGVKIDEDKEFVYLSHYFCGITQAFSDPFTAIPKRMIKKTEVFGKTTLKRTSRNNYKSKRKKS